MSGQTDGFVTSPTIALNKSIAWLHRRSSSDYNALWVSRVDSKRTLEVPLDWTLHPEKVLVSVASDALG